MEECLGDAEDFYFAEEGPGPRNYVRPEPIYVREVSLVVEAVDIPGGGTVMLFHNFDVRELPIVALNHERNFFLAKPIGNHFSTDLDEILEHDLSHNYMAHQ